MKISHSGDWRMYRRLLAYVLPYWRVFGISILAMILLAITNPATAAIFKYIIEGVFLTQDTGNVNLIITALVGLSIVAAAANYISNISLHWVSNKVVMDLRAELFAKLLYLPSQFYDRSSSGELISKFTFDVTQIKEASTNVLNVLVRDSLTIIGLFAWMVYIDWELSVITFLTAPVIAGFLLVIRRRLRRMSRSIQGSMVQINHILAEAINGERIIKVYGAQDQEQQRFDKAINSNRRFNMKLASAANVSSPLVQLVTVIALAVIIYVSSQKAVNGSMGVDDFVSFFTAILMVLGPLKRLARINEHIQKGLAACESVFGLLDEEVETEVTTEDFQRCHGELAFRNVNFYYQNTQAPVLKNINLTIKPRETLAIVGVSGSGKSTLAALIPQFYQSTDGSITLDGKMIGEISLSSLRSNIALVSQDTILFNDTIKHNISYGMADASDEDIYAAAEKAHATEFINALPAGFEEVIADRGSSLSGGQRQRVALARAFLKDAPILILDEATSSLDTDSERVIQKALVDIAENRTCIIIAHRLSTIQNADRVIVMEDGSIIEEGTHRELLEKNGSYARLYQSKNDVIITD